MASTNWTLMEGSPGTSVISWGQSDASYFEAPDGEGVLAFFTRTPVQAASALILDWTNDGTFGPLPGGRGGLIEACMRKYNRGPESAPFIFLADSPNINSARGYRLGLSEEYPYHIVLKKGLLMGGMSIEDEDVLRVGADAFADNAWRQLQLIVTTHPQGDIVLRTYVCEPVEIPPRWSGSYLEDYIDDALGGNQGQPPIAGNYWAGFGHYNRSGSGGLSLFDYVSVGSQTD